MIKESSSVVSSFILRNKEIFSDEILERHFGSQPGIKDEYNSYMYQKCREDVIYHLTYLAQAVDIGSLILFSDYIKWVNITLTEYNVKSKHTIYSFQVMKEVLLEKIPEEHHKEIGMYLDEAVRILEEESSEVESFILEKGDYFNLSAAYLDLILKKQRYDAGKLILDAAEKGVPIKDIYLKVFQPVQQEVGRLWQMNKISVAQEHYCTAAAQLIMSQLYSYIFRTEKNGFKLVSACVSGELHEMGIRMLTDLFELEGWDTHYLGANMPNSGIIRFLEDTKPDIVIISATISYHIKHLKSLIECIRENDKISGIKVMVGGYCFNADRTLWKKVGADAYSADFDSAIKKAAELVVRD